MHVRRKVPERLTIVTDCDPIQSLEIFEDMDGLVLMIRHGTERSCITLSEKDAKHLVSRASKFIREQR